MRELGTFEIDPHRNRKVKDMLPDEQPRERLLRYGAESLSESELLAILLRTGSKKLNVIETSKALLSHFGGLKHLARRTAKEMQAIPGVGSVKAITLEAVFELCRRVRTAEIGEAIVVTSPQTLAAYFAPRLRNLTHEVFIVCFLTSGKELIGFKKISSGGVKATIVDTAEVLRQAIIHEANSIVVVHNHPSGVPEESKADIRLTRRIYGACKTIGIELDDHIILGGGKFNSLRARGYIRD